MENADLVKMMFQCFLSVYSEISVSYYISVDVNETSALIFYNKGVNGQTESQ